MSETNNVNGQRASQAVRAAFEQTRQSLPTSWLKNILLVRSDLNCEPHLTRLKNIRLGRTTPTPDEITLFESVLPEKPSETPKNSTNQ